MSLVELKHQRSYRVDRQKSVDVLSSFLETKDTKVAAEVEWLKSIKADCVLSDSAFLGWYVSLPSSGKRSTSDKGLSEIAAWQPRQPRSHPFSSRISRSIPFTAIWQPALWIPPLLSSTLTYWTPPVLIPSSQWTHLSPLRKYRLWLIKFTPDFVAPIYC